MKRKTTSAALAAKAIRQELKAAGIAAKVTSETYSMGNNVNITLTDETPSIKQKADFICKKYQEGHFDGMIDLYEYSNCRDDIPQVKFVFVRNEMSEAMKQRVYDWLRSNWHEGDKLPELYSIGWDLRLDSRYVSEMVYQQFTGCSLGFWLQNKAA